METGKSSAPDAGEAKDDVVALMAQIQAEATAGRTLVESRLGALREALRPMLHHARTASPAAETQGEANRLFHELNQAMAEPVNPAPFHDLVELGHVPPSSGPAGRVRRRLLAPQERFNLELLGRLSDLYAPVPTATHFTLHVAVTARLLGSVNVILQALTDLEGAVESWDREETAWRRGVLAALENLLTDQGDNRLILSTEERARYMPTPEDLEKVRQENRATADTIMEHVRELATRVAVLTNEGGQIRSAQEDRGERIMEHVRDLATKLAALTNEELQTRRAQEETAGRVMEHVTALAVRVSQAEEERTAAVREADELRQRLESLEKRLTDLEKRPAPERRAAISPAPLSPVEASHSFSPPASGGAVPIGGPEFDFLVWEELTRGDEFTISEEQKKYLPWFEGMEVPVLDAGCGRGEFLELLKDAGIDAYGIDADPSMVAHCQAKGLRVEQAELFDHLRSVPDNSLGGLFLGQVVEHIPPPQLRTLTDLAFAKLAPGAAVVMETINPTCLTTFSGAFYADPTHQKPVHPKALEYFLTASGFGPTELIFSAPIPPEGKLNPVREEAPLDPGVKSVVIQVNANFERLNSVLYGHANYAAAARKPAR